MNLEQQQRLLELRCHYADCARPDGTCRLCMECEQLIEIHNNWLKGVPPKAERPQSNAKEI